MLRPMTVANGEVELPRGVVAQEVVMERGALQLSKRYPLGMFQDNGLLQDYKEFVQKVNLELKHKASKRERQEQRDGYWAEKMPNLADRDAYFMYLNIGVVMMEFESDIEREGRVILVRACHRPRIDPETHQPVFDRWVEFIDKSIAPNDYVSQWDINRTFLTSVCLCLGTNEALVVAFPDVGVLKLLPIDRGGKEILDNSSGRLKGIVAGMGVNQEFNYLKNDLATAQHLKSGLWDSDGVNSIVEKHSEAFAVKGVKIFFCNLFCLRTFDHLFQWIEFVKVQDYPQYVPQYLYKKDQNLRHVIKKDRRIKVDRLSGIRFETNAILDKYRVRGRVIRTKCLAFRKPPPVFWFKELD